MKDPWFVMVNRDTVIAWAVGRIVIRQRGFPGGAVAKKPPGSAADIRDEGSTPESGRSPGGRRGNPLQYSCLRPWRLKAAD